ncbi:MAG: STAS domain-containing protein [Acidobacteriota bacterium]
MHIEFQTTENVLTARMEGSMDTGALTYFDQVPQFRQVPQDVILDLSQVDFMDSAGLGALVALIRKHKEAGRRCMLAAPSPLVARILKLTAIHVLTPVVASLDEALRWLRENPSP